MRRGLIGAFLALASAGAEGRWLLAQTAPAPKTVMRADERVKADVLVVVAHPDDEGGVTPYLARAIHDQHKRVAVVFLTRGGSGGNDYTREHGPALADLREQEGRKACAALGIANVWFLDGKDTASQNVLNSLANWGHGANLEALVRIVRLTRPEVIITWLPGVFIGENHGDHQAAGVLATEAFDLAGDAAAFPAQIAGATKRLEVYLENLTPWQTKKIYYFSDADDQGQFRGTGPAYSVREISPAQKKPYWRLAMDAAKPHRTQFPEDIERMSAMSDEQIAKFMEDPQHMWWPEPMTLTLGKSRVQGPPTGDVFEGIPRRGEQKPGDCRPPELSAPPPAAEATLGGPWGFYRSLGLESCLALPAPKQPEIAVKAGTALLVPLTVSHRGAVDVKIEAAAPDGWKVTRGEGLFRLPDEERTDLAVEILTPDPGKEELAKLGAREVVVRVSEGGRPAGEVRLKVLLKSSALPQ
jgi:LmbE family N-acetylglucosaminyl deacetylase